jgi:hypothetical protein
MSDHLHDTVKKLEIREFFSSNFVKAVMEKKKLGEDSAERKALGSRMPTLFFNAIYANLGRTPEAPQQSREPIVEDLLIMTPQELLRTSNFGKKGLKWIETYLALFGLHLKESSFAIDYAYFTPNAKKVLDLINK